MKNFGFVRTAAASPKVRAGNTEYNIKNIIELAKKAAKEGAAVTVFPELAISGYTCGDLFMQNVLIYNSLNALEKLVKASEEIETVIFAGIPLIIKDRLYNCAAAVFNGEILGIVPKMFIPNYKEFYEKRWFSSGYAISKTIKEITVLGRKVPFGNLLFRDINTGMVIGTEICEDMWVAVPPSSYMVLNGANVIVNLSASNELVSKSDYRKSLIEQQSARGVCGYVYSSAGVMESTTDVVFGGDCIIAENGYVLGETKRFSRDNEIVYADIDIERLVSERILNRSYGDSMDMLTEAFEYSTIDINTEINPDIKKYLYRRVDRTPFIPGNPQTMNERCEEIFNIQASGLATRMQNACFKKAVIGISGGLDSTLAVLVVKRAFEILGLDSKDIYAITMPGFGTTDKTYDNAVKLIKDLGADFKEINIKDACLQHFKDIEHDPEVHDITYENTQARERTKILMNYSNKVGGLVIGTGDLSELALGWCTYNGDHMSMYGVNCSIPKTLVQHLIRWYAGALASDEAKDTLYDILDTPISPELLPPDENGNIKQKTESVVGPYELNDFFLYHVLRFGTRPEKVMFLAEKAFSEGDTTYTREEIKKWLTMFYRRFFTQQFKRSCLPDGPKVGTVSLSPRGDWRMPSDADGSQWIEEVNNIK